MKHASVRVPLQNGHRYPALLVKYTVDDDGLGYHGEAAFWLSGSEKGDAHTISIRQTSPLGMISITLDGNEHYCRAMAQFEGVDIKARDLQWAALWAVAAINNNKEQ